jgi:hypothetical protein
MAASPFRPAEIFGVWTFEFFISPLSLGFRLLGVGIWFADPLSISVIRVISGQNSEAPRAADQTGCDR